MKTATIRQFTGRWSITTKISRFKSHSRRWRRGALLELKYTLNSFNRKVIVLVCLEKTSCYLYMLSGMFFSVAGFTHLSFIRQGYYQGYYHFSALLWNKIPAKYPCCPGCFSLWQDLFCCLLSDKDINNKLIINFLLTRSVL